MSKKHYKNLPELMTSVMSVVKPSPVHLAGWGDLSLLICVIAGLWN